MLDVDLWLSSTELGPHCFVFDPAFYAQSDDQALWAVRLGMKAAIEDFRHRGSSLGYSPNAYFDTRYYVQTYDDVQSLIGCGRFMTAFEHYCQIGYRDRSPHWLFDISFYLSRNSDIPSGMISACGGAYGHYLLFGDREERQGHPLFDSAFYKAQNAERQHVIERRGAFCDYLTECVGVFPDLQCSPYFDPLWYVGRYELAEHGVRGGAYRCALQHYLMCRPMLELDPLPQFSEQHYRSQYPDISGGVSRKIFACGYDHFLKFGMGELRSPCLDIDLVFYSDLEMVKKTLDSRGSFWHLLTFGVACGLPTAHPLPRDFAISEADARSMFITSALRSLRQLGSSITFDAVTNPDLDVILTLRGSVATAVQALASVRSSFQGSIRLSGVDCRKDCADVDLDGLFSNAQIVKAGQNLSDDISDVIATTTAPVVLLIDDSILVHGHAIEICCSRLREEHDVGAVGVKVLQPNGLILEAGGVITRDGKTIKWLRDAAPDMAEANYVREVDFCSTGFLAVRGSLLRNLGGYIAGYADGLFQSADLCLRMKEHGSRTIYEPGATITQLEHQSELDARKAGTREIDLRKALRVKFPYAFKDRPWGPVSHDLANMASRGRRVLLVTDSLPHSQLDVMRERAIEIVKCMVSDGWQVTMFVGSRGTVHQLRCDLQIPETVELICQEDVGNLGEFLTTRSEYFVLIWVQLTATSESFLTIDDSLFVRRGGARLLIDAGGISPLCSRSPECTVDLALNDVGLTRERVEDLVDCDHLVVSRRVAPVDNCPITAFGTTVGCVGFHIRSPTIVSSYAERSGLIHILNQEPHTSQYLDELERFVTEALPFIRQVGEERPTLLTVVHDERVALPSCLHTGKQLRLVRLPANLEMLLSQHLVAVIFGPYTVFDVSLIRRSAACGTPCMISAQIPECVDLSVEEFVPMPDNTSPETMARAVLNLCESPLLWGQLQAKALEKVGRESRANLFSRQVTAAVEAAMAD